MTILQFADVLKDLGFTTMLGWIAKNVVSYYKKKKEREEFTIETLQQNDIKLQERDDILGNAIMVIHHDLLYQNCNRYIVRGWITPAERDNLGYIFRAYKSLGGNGTGESIYNRAMQLPLKIE